MSGALAVLAAVDEVAPRRRPRKLPPGALAAAVRAEAPISSLEHVDVEAPAFEAPITASTVLGVAAALADVLTEQGMDRRAALLAARRVAARGWLRTIGVESVAEQARRIGCSERTLLRDERALAELSPDVVAARAA